MNEEGTTNILQCITDLISTLTGNEALVAFCRDRWGKDLQVKHVFKKREAISVSDDLPVIMIVWAGVTEGETIDDHTLILLSGFYQEDPEKAQVEKILFSELIRDAIIADRERNKYALYTRPKSVGVDLGFLHPVYFIERAIGIEIQV